MADIEQGAHATARRLEAELARSPRQLMIDGKLVPAQSGKTFATLNPATGVEICQVAEGSAADVDAAVLAARAALSNPQWRDMSAVDRSAVLNRLADLIERDADELAVLECIDNGKPASMTRWVEIEGSIKTFRYFAGWPTKFGGETLPVSPRNGARILNYTVREPVGVCGLIVPWNYPMSMAAWKVAPALAAGCTVILKPAEQTPLTALRLGELALEAGVPPGVFNVVTGFGEAGAALVDHPGVDKVAFTGSTEVGKAIVRGATGNLKKVSLELGGKSPQIVLPDADLDAAAASISAGIFFNHGQCCNAGSRLFVQEKVFDKVVAGISANAARIKLGAGMDPATEMGPMVSEVQHGRVKGYLQSGQEEGARAVTGGSAPEGRGYFVNPTVLVDTKPDMKVVREEIFGPVVVAIPFKEVDDKLVAAANDTIYGLAAGVWSRDIAKANQLANAIKAGSVWINCYHVFDAALPFGGYKQSGWGREMGQAVLSNYLEAKAITSRIG